MGRVFAGLVLLVSVAACAQIQGLGGQGGGSSSGNAGAAAPLPGPDGGDVVRPVQRPAAPVPQPQSGPSASAASLDTVSEAQKEAARQAASTGSGGAVLGDVTVALGDPADPGLWVKSALVEGDRPGTVQTGSGDAIAVTLRPLGSGDGGPQISLAALRALGLPLTGLHPVTLAEAG